MTGRSCRIAKQVGRLRHLATIETPSTPATGETKPTWSNLATDVPMSREYKAPREVTAGDRVQGIPTEVVMMKWKGGVNETMRVRFPTTSGTDDVLEIIGVGDPVGDKRWLRLDCRRIWST